MISDRTNINWVVLSERMLVLATAGIVAWTIMRVNDNHDRSMTNLQKIDFMGSNRFTNKDGEQHLVFITENKMGIKAVTDDIAEIKQSQIEILRLMHAKEK